MADEPPSPTAKLRLFLDVTILIKAVSFPRLPFEIVRLGARRDVSIVLSAGVVASARTHVARLYPSQLTLLDQLLYELDYEEVADPPAERIRESRGLCRDEDDIGVALAAIDAAVDYLVLRTGVSLDT
jgi:hypothetical protein